MLISDFTQGLCGGSEYKSLSVLYFPSAHTCGARKIKTISIERRCPSLFKYIAIHYPLCGSAARTRFQKTHEIWIDGTRYCSHDCDVIVVVYFIITSIRIWRNTSSFMKTPGTSNGFSTTMGIWNLGGSMRPSLCIKGHPVSFLYSLHTRT